MSVVGGGGGRAVRELGALSTVGLVFVLSIVIGAGGGYWLDGRLGSSPWLFFIGFALGVASGALNAYRTITRLSDNQQAE